MAQSRTTTTYESDKGETKTKILRLQDQATAQFKNAAKDIKEKVQDLDEDEIDAFVNENFEKLNKTFMKHSDELRSDVLKKKPKKPKREDFGNDEEYEEASKNYKIECEHYKEFVGWAMSVVQKLMDWISDLFKKIKEFFQNLWTWIKNAFANIAEKVQRFVKFVGEKISGLYDYLFG